MGGAKCTARAIHPRNPFPILLFKGDDNTMIKGDNLFIYLFTDLPLKTYKTSRFDITKEQRRLGWKCHTEISPPIIT